MRGRAGRVGACAVEPVFGSLCGLRSAVASGPRVIALHGWLDNAGSVVPLAPHLPGLDLAALDMPGHGASFCPAVVGAAHLGEACRNVLRVAAQSLGTLSAGYP